MKKFFKKIQINQWILKFVLSFSWIYKRFNIDLAALETIVTTKLIMEERKPNMGFQNKTSQTKGTNSKVMLVFQSILCLFLGAMYMLFILTSTDLFSGYTMYFTWISLVMLMVIVMDFSTVLVDEKDTFTLFTKPLNDATLSASRFVHILIHVIKFAVLIGFPGMLYTFIEKGIFNGIIFMVELVLVSFTTLLFACILYVSILKIKNVKRVKRMMANFQIFFTITLVGQFYLLPKLIGNTLIEKISLYQFKAIYVLPTSWFAELQAITVKSELSIKAVVFALLGILLPVFLLWVFARFFANTFNQSIVNLALHAGGTESPTISAGQRKKSSIEDKIVGIATNNPIENSAFRLVWKLSDRYTDFKMRLYPSFGFVIIFMVYLFLNIPGDFHEKLLKARSHSYALFSIYYCGMVLTAAFANLKVSPQYKASWIYFTAPIDCPGSILSGGFKAISIKFFTPIYLVLMSFGLFIFGLQALNDFILAYFLMLSLFIVINLFMFNSLPFSAPVEVAKGKWYLVFLFLFMQAIIAGIHFFIYRWETATWIAIPISIMIFYFMLKAYKKQTWEEIKIYDGDA